MIRPAPRWCWPRAESAISIGSRPTPRGARHRPRHGGAGGRADRGRGIRAVSSDRDRHWRRSRPARDRGAARRRRDRSSIRTGDASCSTSTRPPNSRRAILSRAASSPASRRPRRLSRRPRGGRRELPDALSDGLRELHEAPESIPVTTPIPIAPAAHYHMGGVWTDAMGRSSLEGLWAAGEVASTGVHGANRLASNSLLEAIVFGARVARTCRDAACPRSTRRPQATAMTRRHATANSRSSRNCAIDGGSCRRHPRRRGPCARAEGHSSALVARATTWRRTTC